jgi:hypothetical protein
MFIIKTHKNLSYDFIKKYILENRKNDDDEDDIKKIITHVLQYYASNMITDDIMNEFIEEKSEERFEIME